MGPLKNYRKAILFIESKKKNNGLWYKSYKHGDKIVHNSSYCIWTSMMYRVGKHSSYKDVTVSDEFKDYQLFTDWYVSQIGYGLENYELDKDLLFPLEREYSSKNCVLIPMKLNNFLIDRHNLSGKYPTGVYFDSWGNKFKSQISDDGVVKSLGRFDDVVSARKAYIKAKSELIAKWVVRLKDGEYLVDTKVIGALESWREKLINNDPVI